MDLIIILVMNIFMIKDVYILSNIVVVDLDVIVMHYQQLHKLLSYSGNI
jgi:pyoverdine/dityrosine biosynthesis protein Dit1